MQHPAVSELEQAAQHFQQGVEAAEAGRLQDALHSFEAALALAPGRPSVLVNLGITLFRLGWHTEARPVLRQATAADTTGADGWAYLGLNEEALGQGQNAVDALRRALDITPAQAGLWLSQARCLLRLDQPVQALQAFDQAVATGPELAAAWSERGSLLRELGRLSEAAESFEKALALGADPALHGYYLASVRGGSAPAHPPRQYVETLFDAYADEFRQHLVGQLGYQAHEALVRPLLQTGKRFASVLDLGCGSGLCGQLIKPCAGSVDGVDLSQAMLAQARATGAYRELVHADIAAYLAQVHRSDDLVLAADVFIYVGDLAAVFAAVRRGLRPGGCFAFSVELAEGSPGVQLRSSLRYAHTQAYVSGLVQAHGYKVAEAFTAPLRHEQGEPVQGLYVYLN